MAETCSTQGKERCIKILVGNLKRREHSEDLGVVGRVILEGILRKQVGRVWTDFIWPRIGTSGGLL